MVALKIINLGGMIPSVDDRLLPTGSAALARDTYVSSGAVRGFKRLTKIYDLLNPATQMVFRIPTRTLNSSRLTSSFWLEFDSPFTSVVGSPASGDQFDRFYWVSPVLQPSYNSRDRIEAGDPPLVLGVPRPTVAPAVSVSGGAAPVESRAYVYTWVTVFGEEGPPSLPTLVTGNASGTWRITMTAPTSGDTTGRLLEKVRVYRTVSGVSGETDYFFVAEVPIATLVYDDLSLPVTNNRLLQSLFWTAPPSDLEGFAAMPNGIIAAWRDNEIWFCEPFRPHAWPVVYQISVDAPVVGCGVIGQTLIVCTEGSPYAISGANPSSMSQTRLAAVEPCVSRGSILSTPSGVIYASPNGLVLANASGAGIVSRQMLAKEDWADLLYLPTIFGASFNGGYYAFGSVAVGCFEETAFGNDAFLQLDLSGAFSGAFIVPDDPRIAVSELTQPAAVRNVYNDVWTGELFVLRDDGLFWLDQSATCSQPREPYIWRSKVFEVPGAENLGAMRIYFSTHNCSPELNPVRNVSQTQELAADQYGVARVYADGRLVVVRELRVSGEILRLTSGFKATYWQVEIEARVQLNSVELASTAKELGSV